jgi:ADP-heptose:LPS heptosyltransferase
MTIAQFISSLKGRLAWHANRILLHNLWLLNALGGRLTVEDLFGAPGDTLLTAILCRSLKQNYPRLRINVVTKNADVVQHDPHMDELNGPVGFCHLQFEYLGILEEKASEPNILAPILSDVGILHYEYKARVYLREEEIAAARQRLPETGRPIVTINVMSKEQVKVWRLQSWQELVARLVKDFTVVQLGDATEPAFPEVISFGGKLNKRESMAMLSLARVHVGPDSFLMHAANGLDVPSVIIYGGSRPPSCLGYAANQNLYVQLDCSPCWLHNTRGETCPHDMRCMDLISVDSTYSAVLAQAQLAKAKAA